MEKIQIDFTSEIVSSYKRLSYRVWFALAEFVDNSTQAYLNDKVMMDELFNNEKSQLEVNINYFKGDKLEDDYFEIIDNSIGMSVDDLKKAFKIGQPPVKNTGRSKYGLGMKTSAFWFGDDWTIKTKKIGEKKSCYIELNVDSISSGTLDLNIKEDDSTEAEHYTVITITNLHRRFKGRTITKIKSFLSSIYRIDLQNNNLHLYWNGERLSWEGYNDEDFISDFEGNPSKREFSFEIDGKTVNGWAGALKSGGRSKGGFALIQANRVIQSPPNGYKPETLFGEQEGGINDLVNQRLVGELFMDGFEVSHTKDSIQWEGTQMDDLEDELYRIIGDFRKVAIDYRKNAVDERGPTDLEFKVALDEMLEELNSGEVADIIVASEIPPIQVIEESNKQLEEATVEAIEPTEITLGSLIVRLYVDDNMSPNDPYVINNSTSQIDLIIIIVNKNHPYWNELNGSKGVLNYLRHCVYDGVSEWKAFFKQGAIRPDTVKHIKDDLLRVPFNIERSNI